ncbi:LuxR C-terminal-related transcriptional regulator [Paenibacillus sp. YYML68]|uniref:LuxR C-terminal-related transcriptional regulator n=1 Tax=Paenibacillus sp. YYML68 TaxID=2909250 RepID=UPI002490F697|nr:LuxR C-terminal-related transcriptional regulator [Paenibacillus sp. YYML68]
MLNPFEVTDVLAKTWVTLMDVDINIINSWKSTFFSRGFNQHSFKLKKRVVLNSMDEIQKLIDIVKDELKNVAKNISIPHVFFLTNHHGVVYDLSAPSHVIQSLESYNIGVGTSFSLEAAGINAVSVAMKLKDKSIVQGIEHSMDIFKSWSCICFPIRNQQDIVGYLDLSFHNENDVAFAGALMERIVHNIELKLIEASESESNVRFEENCDKYKLTNKEKQVAHYWICGETQSEIASLLGISKETVKSHLRNISKKVDAHNKITFLKKFV